MAWCPAGERKRKHSLPLSDTECRSEMLTRAQLTSFCALHCIHSSWMQGIDQLLSGDCRARNQGSAHSLSIQSHPHPSQCILWREFATDLGHFGGRMLHSHLFWLWIRMQTLTYVCPIFATIDNLDKIWIEEVVATHTWILNSVNPQSSARTLWSRFFHEWVGAQVCSADTPT